MAKTNALVANEYEDPTVPGGSVPSDIIPDSANSSNSGENFDMAGFMDDLAPGAPAAVHSVVPDIELVSVAAAVAEVSAPVVAQAPAPGKVLGLVAPAKLDQSVPKIDSGTVLDYAMSVDVDQRPAVALVLATKKMLAVGTHLDEVVEFVHAAVKNMQSVEGFSGRAKDELDAFLFADGGVLEKFKATFATERDLNRKAATGGLIDAAEAVEKLVEKFGNIKLGEFDKHALESKAELDREMHRITLSSLQSTLEFIVAEKASLAADREKLEAANKYARRMGIAYAVAGLFAGIAIALGTIAFH